MKKFILSQELLLEKHLITPIIVSVLLFSALAGAFFVEPAKANPIINVYNDISPPEGIQAPIITIHTPINGSSYPNDITLTFDVAIPQTNGNEDIDSVTKIYYKGSWETEEKVVAEKVIGAFSVDLSDVRGGNLSVTVFAVGEGLIGTGEDYREENGVLYSYHYYDRFEMIGDSTVSFIKDLVPPRITILSPHNTTYVSSEVELDFIVNEVASEILYCLDGKENQTTTGKLTLTGLENGAHNITLYAYDLAGNAAMPQTLFFSVDLPESWIFVLAIISLITVAVVGVGLVICFKKRKH